MEAPIACCRWGASPGGGWRVTDYVRPVLRTKPTLWRLFERACKGKYNVESSRRPKWLEGTYRATALGPHLPGGLGSHPSWAAGRSKYAACSLMVDEEAALLFFPLEATVPAPSFPHDPIHPWIFLSFSHTPSVTRRSFARSLVRYNPAIVGQSLSHPRARSLTIIASAPSASCFASTFPIPGSWFLVPGASSLFGAFSDTVPTVLSPSVPVSPSRPVSCPRISFTSLALLFPIPTSLTRAALLFFILHSCLHKDLATAAPRLNAPSSSSRLILVAPH